MIQDFIRVLYIEDDKGSARLLMNNLVKFGYQVTLAESGHTGLEQLRKETFDVLLIDHTLGDISGLEVIEAVKGISEAPPAMIMVTGTGDEYIAVDALKSGADDYLVKDLDGTYIPLLNEVIRAALERRALRLSQIELMKEQSLLIEDLKTFSYAVAHDLKQPLGHFSAILGLLEHYIEEQDQKAVENKLTQLRASIRKMHSTMDALLLLSRVRELEDLQLESLDMHQLVWQVVERLENMIQPSKAVIRITGTLPEAVGYQPWVEEIWMNYLTNAIKYGGIPPVIEIGASPKGKNEILYWVRDNGEGFSAEEQKKLFLPFSRLKVDNIEGHGLGLAIVAMIARKLRSELIVKSEVGKGSTFGFTLPKPSK